MTPPDRTRADDILAYRPFIDGLRAVSIIAVVAYHAGVPGVTGGFVGVDVFFVISGYLIINQVVAGLRSGSFSFAGFWARRVLRILPPYLLVIGATLALAPFVLVSPAEFTELGNEALASALMVVNHYFFASQGYFDVEANTKPLLHLWSLAVEEQFYLVAPLLLVGLWWMARRRPSARRAIWTTAIGVLFVASLAACIAATDRARNPAFYLTPFRAWEFIAGGAVPLFLDALRRRPPIVADLAGLAGAALILGSVFGLAEGVSYPAAYAVMPVAGACLVILAGTARPETPVARVLAVTPMVWIGLVSYAWYLWHWPLIVFARVYNFGETMPLWTGGAVALSLALAVATRFLVELPVKRWREQAGPVALGWRTVGAGIAGAVAVGLLGLVHSGVVAPAIERADPTLWVAEASSRGRCTLIDETRFDPGCAPEIGDRPIGLLVGNSHAGVISRAIGAEAEAAGTALVALVRSGCLPYLPRKGVPLNIVPRCRTGVSQGMAAIRTMLPRPLEYAIIAARWNVTTMDGRQTATFGEAAFAAAGLPWPPPADIRAPLAVGLAPMIEELRTLGAQRILIIGPAPEFARRVPECIARIEGRGGDRAFCAAARETVELRRAETIATLRYLATLHPDVRFIDPIDAFCDRTVCRPYDDAGVLFIDDNHVSSRGADILIGALADELAWVMGATPSAAESAPPASPD